MSHGYNALLVIVDRLSKHAHIIPTTSDISSVGIARLFCDNVWKLHHQQKDLSIIFEYIYYNVLTDGKIYISLIHTLIRLYISTP